jgi:hypothetical protein
MPVVGEASDGVVLFEATTAEQESATVPFTSTVFR